VFVPEKIDVCFESLEDPLFGERSCSAKNAVSLELDVFLSWKIPILFVPRYLFRRIDVRVYSVLEDSDFICSGE
jgi:hypothetical protein